MSGRLVTISATYGAGGTVIAPLLARRMRVPFADRLTSARDLPNIPSEHASKEELSEPSRSVFLRGLALLSADWNIPAPTDADELPSHVREQLLAGLEELIAAGGAVVHGRAAAPALGRRPGVFHVRLDGPPDRRAARGAAWEGCDLDTARQRLEKTDSVRERYVRNLYRVDPADPTLYNLMLDTTVMPVDACVEMLAAAADAACAFDDGDVVALARDAIRRLDQSD
jgi:cytidylate kinase